MKQKNLPDDIESKSLDELKEILNNLVEKVEKNKASFAFPSTSVYVEKNS